MENFEAPIAGESLTTTPRNAPYERPPEIVDPEEAIQMHLTRLSEAEKMEAILDALELGVDVKSLTKGYLRSAVANGIHTVDISLLITPVIHEFIKRTADDAGVEYEEGLVNEGKESKRREAMEMQKAKIRLRKGQGIEQEEIPEERLSLDSEELPRHPVGSDKPRGLMKRRGEV